VKGECMALCRVGISGIMRLLDYADSWVTFRRLAYFGALLGCGRGNPVISPQGSSITKEREMLEKFLTEPGVVHAGGQGVLGITGLVHALRAKSV